MNDEPYLATPIAPENIEPEIERRMRIPLVKVPAKFDGYLTEEELGEYQAKDLRFVIPTRRVAHACQALWLEFILHNRAVRAMEAELLREKLRQKKRLSRGVELIIASVVSAVVSGAVALWFQKIFKVIP